MSRCCPGRLRTTTVIRLENEAKTLAYITKLDELEKKYKLFAAHDLLDEINGMTIVDFINGRLDDLLGCTLQDLQNNDCLVDRICRAFFKDKDVIENWKRKSDLPMFEGLLLGFIFHRMRKMFLEIHEEQLADEYEFLRDKMDAECTTLLQTCFRKSEEETRRALEINYHPFIHSGECVAHRIRLMEIAYLGKAHKFLAHPACQKAIDMRWQPSYRIGPTSFWLYVFWFLPPLLILTKTQPYVKIPEDSTWTRLKKFYRSTSSKYVVHMSFRCMYMFIYSAALITLSGRSVQKENITEFILQFVVMTWQCSYLIEMAFIFFQKRLIIWALRNKADFHRNLIIGVNVVAFVVALLWQKSRFVLLPLADLCFYISYIMAVVRSMRILYVDYFFGSIVYMINKMVWVMIKFFFIFFFFWAAFAVSYISLSGHFHTNNSTYADLPWQLFYHGAFEIFGEAIDGDKKGEIASCNGTNTYSYTDSSLHCLFRTWMLPVILFLYILISGILLINLLTALLTKKYDDISKEYPIYWKVALYARLAEYEERPFVPPPFTIFYLVTKFVLSAISAAGKRILGIYRHLRPSTAAVSKRSSLEMTSMENPSLTNPSDVLLPPTPSLARRGPEEAGPSTIIEIEEQEQHPAFFSMKGGFKKPTLISDLDFPVSFSTMSEEFMKTAAEGFRAVSMEREQTQEEQVLRFIRSCRRTMVNEQEEQKSQRQRKRDLLEKILQNLDIGVAPRMQEHAFDPIYSC